MFFFVNDGPILSKTDDKVGITTRKVCEMFGTRVADIIHINMVEEKKGFRLVVEKLLINGAHVCITYLTFN